MKRPLGMRNVICAAMLVVSVFDAIAEMRVAQPESTSAMPLLGSSRLTPNLADASIERPLRYRPEGGDFVIENGGEFFNRPLYGGNTAFRVDAGDVPEFSLYLPGRGGNVRLGVRTPTGAKWLHETAQIVARYRPGEMHYDIRDPLLGATALLRIVAMALPETEGLVVRAELVDAADVELVWAYGGVNGRRGKRDGDIGTESVPISEYFQLQPEFCRGNEIVVDGAAFTLKTAAATLHGSAPTDATLAIADAREWKSCAALLASAGSKSETPVVVGRCALTSGTPRFIAVVRGDDRSVRANEDLEIYREVTALREGIPPNKISKAAEDSSHPGTTGPDVGRQLAGASERERARSLRSDEFAPAKGGPLGPSALPRIFDHAASHFEALRNHVRVETPDPFINAAMGSLNVAADAVWDEPQGAIMHGAIAWRTKLLGWRGPYALDALGWTERARRNFSGWVARQNTNAIPERLPPADANTNLARNEAALHSNGDISNSHYDMNAVFIDALFRHLQWTGDWQLACEVWPVIVRHLAWERRLFRREFGPEKLPLYEAYAMIWASDDLQYSGGGATHASAYNYWHNRMAARVARGLGVDSEPYDREAALIARGLRELLWLPADAATRTPAHFGEFKDLLGRQLVHPNAALWTVYHSIDSEVTTATEAWQLINYVDRAIPHLPVRGPSVPTDAWYHVLSSTDWMPYTWSINNVVMGENVHTALAMWQAGRVEDAFTLMKSALLASMFMGICPGNVGSMNYLDVYRRESQRDFADGSGVLSRAMVEGLFGLHPDALSGKLRVAPGFPAAWTHASIEHPLVGVRFTRDGQNDVYTVNPRWTRPMMLQLQVPLRHESADVTVNGVRVVGRRLDGPAPRLEVTAPTAKAFEVAIRWSGAVVATAGELSKETAQRPSAANGSTFDWRAPLAPGIRLEPVALDGVFNDRVTEIFRRGKYRSPRSPFASLALPSQGIGAWAGHVNAEAEIDDSGVRRVAAENGGRLLMSNGVMFTTPASKDGANVSFVSQWDNYPRESVVALSGHASRIFLLMAGSTNPMQSRFDNGEVIVEYGDGTSSRLALRNPETWWPIEQDYFTDDYQFRIDGPLPPRVDLKTGDVRVLDVTAFKGRGRVVPGGAATVLQLELHPEKTLRSLTVRALANDVVIGLMAATLVRE